ncbi:MAG: putative quinol monooxygenase [Rhodoferax sp.]|jgi:quinol monooxygenase YgiN
MREWSQKRDLAYDRKKAMIIILGSVTVLDGQYLSALAISQEHVARSRKEPGCIAHAVHQDSENPQRLVFVEQWESQAALALHFAVPASRSFAKAIRALAAEPPNMALYEASEVKL